MAKPSSFEVGDVVRVGDNPTLLASMYGPPTGTVGVVKRVIGNGDHYVVGFFTGDSYAFDICELDLIRLNKET